MRKLNDILNLLFICSAIYIVFLFVELRKQSLEINKLKKDIALIREVLTE